VWHRPVGALRAAGGLAVHRQRREPPSHHLPSHHLPVTTRIGLGPVPVVFFQVTSHTPEALLWWSASQARHSARVRMCNCG
jgi:hypothetical protein